MQIVFDNIGVLHLDNLRGWRVLLTVLVIFGSVVYAIVSLVIDKNITFFSRQKKKQKISKKEDSRNNKKTSPLSDTPKKEGMFSSMNSFWNQIFNETSGNESLIQKKADIIENSSSSQDISRETQQVQESIYDDTHKRENTEPSAVSIDSEMDDLIIEPKKVVRWRKISYRKTSSDEESKPIDTEEDIEYETKIEQEKNIVTEENDEKIFPHDNDFEKEDTEQGRDEEIDILMTQETVTQIEQQSKTHIQREKLRIELDYLKKKQQRDKYESTLIETLAQDHEDTNVLEYLADFYMMDSQSKKALPLYKKIVDQQPENHLFLRKMSQAYMVLQDLETAEVLLDTSLVLHPKTPKYAISLVEIYYKTQRKEMALSLMEDIVKRRPDNMSYRNTLINMYEEKGDYEKVISSYENMLLIDPTNLGLKRKLLEARSMIS